MTQRRYFKAFLNIGLSATDPACGLSPKHGLIREARAAAQEQLIPLTLRYREITR